MATDYSSIRVKCKNCGKEAPANSFVLDHVYRMVVCPQCIKDRQKREIIHKEAKEQPVVQEDKKKPAGWDHEDELIEKAHAAKMAKRMTQEMPVQMADGKYRYRCPKCKYEFVYNRATKTPSRCPYCNWEIFN